MCLEFPPNHTCEKFSWVKVATINNKIEKAQKTSVPKVKGVASPL